MELKPLDKYKLKVKIIEAGKLVWSILINISRLVLILFILITCITFWNNYGISFVELRKPISQMLLIVLILFGLNCIDYIKNLRIK
jgi:phosphatidylglycerophosphate synthase